MQQFAVGEYLPMAGQKLAIERALTCTGISIADYSFLESHGTGTGTGKVFY